MTGNTAFQPNQSAMGHAGDPWPGGPWPATLGPINPWPNQIWPQGQPYVVPPAQVTIAPGYSFEWEAGGIRYQITFATSLELLNFVQQYFGSALPVKSQEK
jgi:hypothetical protein